MKTREIASPASWLPPMYRLIGRSRSSTGSLSTPVNVTPAKCQSGFARASGKVSWWSATYPCHAALICRRLFEHTAWNPDCLALDSAGSSRPSSTAMVASVTSNSTREKPGARRRMEEPVECTGGTGWYPK